MGFEYLNQMIKYIEENLTNDIEYKKLAKMVGISEYNLQRIFSFLTNMSLSEYIKKRRLSKAFEELKTTNIKVIDLAIKYKYESAISFTRAFKNTFGITPSQCKLTNEEYKLFPIIKFNNDSKICKELQYEIKNIESVKLYCIEVHANTYDDILYKIRKLYIDIKKNGLHQKLNEIGMYGVSIFNKEGYSYYVGSTKQYEKTKEFIIPKGKYAVFKVNSRNQNDITDVEKVIYKQWVKSIDYEIDGELSFELYYNDICYLYILIKDKQN